MTAKRLMGILAEINDVEVLILSITAERDLAVYERQELQDYYYAPLRLSSDGSESSDRRSVLISYFGHLRQIELIEAIYSEPLSRDFEAFELKRRFEGDEVTDLGRLLLKYIDVVGSKSAYARYQAAVAQ